jgi:hypothetical protein
MMLDLLAFARDGHALLEGLVQEPLLQRLRAAVAPFHDRPGVRELLARAPAVAELLQQPWLSALGRSVLGARTGVVRCCLFGKGPTSNWAVGWHQDVTIAVRERHEVPGHGPWSVKGGLPHVQVPGAVLERMLALRLHLDDTDEESGALRVVPGSHGLLRLSEAAIQAAVALGPQVVCRGRAGSVLALRPLLLHASSPVAPGRLRRVIHLELAPPLDPPLAWGEWHPLPG